MVQDYGVGVSVGLTVGFGVLVAVTAVGVGILVTDCSLVGVTFLVGDGESGIIVGEGKGVEVGGGEVKITLTLALSGRGEINVCFFKIKKTTDIRKKISKIITVKRDIVFCCPI